MKILTDSTAERHREDVLLDEISAKYIQEPDCTEARDEYQELILSTRDGGGGKFLHIKTTGWSITAIDADGKIDLHELTLVLEDFIKKYNEVH